MKRFQELDSLRGIACLLVLLFHYTNRYSEIFNTNITSSLINFKYGGLGVDLFFIISGFVIFLTIKNTTKPLDFVFKRFSRLYPTFWVCMFITFFIVKSSDLIDYHRSFSDLLINLTMIPDIFGVKRIDGVYWSLLPELAFYLLMLIMILTKKLKNINIICYIWLIVIILNSFQDVMPIRVLLNLRFGHLFIIGISFYKIKSGDSNWQNHLLILFSYLTSFTITDSIEKQIILLGFIVVFYLFVYNKLKWIKIKPLILVGKVSYALYLIHQFIGYIIISELIKIGIENNILLILVPTTIVLVMSYIITFYIEKPIQLFLRKTWSNLYTKI
jgi:peptidoglycan/LPS O-acetylase OafA/YrhL